MAKHRRIYVLVGMVLATGVLVGSFSRAQDSPGDKALGDLWEDFVHYVRIARPEMARSFGQAIIDRNVPAKDVYVLSTKTSNLQALLARAEGMEGLPEVVGGIRTLLEEGYVQMRSDPNEIANSIAMLTQGARAYSVGSARLVESGEFAMPQLVQKLVETECAGELSERILNVLPRVGKEAVRPLSVVLQTDDAKLQQALASVLGEIGYAHAVPRLRELYQREDILPATKAIVERALVACGGQGALEQPLSALCFESAEAYYDRNDSVRADARYPVANVWYWEPALGLTFKVVPRPIFCDVYAMRMSRLALAHDPTFRPAVSLWLAANIRKEADLPAGKTDPLRGETQPAAAFYVRAAGAGYAQEALARALGDTDPRVAVEVIKALADTAGAKSLVSPIEGGAQPLVEALTYPDRRVRFLAAVSLANALPDEVFVGSPLVLSVLNEALRQRGQRTALLIVSDESKRNLLKDGLRTKGYEVMEQTDINHAVAEVVKIGGVDVIVLSESPAPLQVISAFRQEPAMGITPVVIASAGSEQIKTFAASDGRTIVMGPTIDTESLDAALTAATLLAGATLDETEVTAWAVRAALAVRRLGLTGNETFNLERSRESLAGSLMGGAAEVQVASAEALATLISAEAQRAIVALPADVAAADGVRIPALKALAASIRQRGNHLTDADADVILGIVSGDGSQPLREAAARVLGAMDLSSQQIQPLIVATEGND